MRVCKRDGNVILGGGGSVQAVAGALCVLVSGENLIPFVHGGQGTRHTPRDFTTRACWRSLGEQA